MITVIAERVSHDSGIRVALKFPYDRDLAEVIKTLPDARWSNRLQCWHVADVENIEAILLEKLSRHAFVDYSALRRKDIAERIREIRNEKERRRIAKNRSFSLASKEYSGSKTDNNPKEETGQPSEYLELKQGLTWEADQGTIPVDLTIKHPVTIPNTKTGQPQGAFSNAAPEKAHDPIPETPLKTAQGIANIALPEPLQGKDSGFIPRNDSSYLASPAGNCNRLSEQAEHDLIRYREWLESHRYPPNTVRTYTSMMEAFLKFAAPKEASDCDANDLVRMVNEFILPRGLSYSYQNQLISAVKKFYKEICSEKIDPGTFTRPRTRHKLPNVLSKEEVKKILTAPLSEKHRLLLSVIYGCGLRRSEVIMLEPDDIDRDVCY